MHARERFEEAASPSLSCAAPWAGPRGGAHGPSKQPPSNFGEINVATRVRGIHLSDQSRGRKQSRHACFRSQPLPGWDCEFKAGCVRAFPLPSRVTGGGELAFRAAASTFAAYGGARARGRAWLEPAAPRAADASFVASGPRPAVCAHGHGGQSTALPVAPPGPAAWREGRRCGLRLRGGGGKVQRREPAGGRSGGEARQQDGAGASLARRGAPKITHFRVDAFVLPSGPRTRASPIPPPSPRPRLSNVSVPTPEKELSLVQREQAVRLKPSSF